VYLRAKYVFVFSVFALFAILGTPLALAQDIQEEAQQLALTYAFWQVIATFIAIPAAFIIPLFLEWRSEVRRRKRQ
jgi:formate-dependent nitrite reductase membrane component NrfD